MARVPLQAEFVDPNEVRIDRLVVNGAKHFAGALHRQTGVDVWGMGLGSIVETLVSESPDIPKNPITPVSIARHLGILPKR